MLDPLFFCPEHFVFLADVMAVTLSLSEGWGSDTAMEADWPSFSASDSNGSDGGKYRGEELGCSSLSPTAASVGMASVFVCGCVICGCVICGCVVCGCVVYGCAVVTGCPVAGWHVIGFGMTGRMTVV